MEGGEIQLWPKRDVNPMQYEIDFDLMSGDKLGVVENVFREYPGMIGHIRKDTWWRYNKNGNAAFIVSGEPIKVFDKDCGRVLTEVDDLDKFLEPLAAAILKLDDASICECGEILSAVREHIKPTGYLGISEPLGDDDLVDRRAYFDILANELDLVDTSHVVVDGGEYEEVCWRSRTPKKRKKAKRTGHDMTNSDNAPYYKRLWIKMVEEYHRYDLSLKNTKKSPLYKEMLSSTFVPRTIQRIKDGMGVTVASNTCECEWLIDPRGSIFHDKCCDDPECTAGERIIDARDKWGRRESKLSRLN